MPLLRDQINQLKLALAEADAHASVDAWIRLSLLQADVSPQESLQAAQKANAIALSSGSAQETVNAKIALGKAFYNAMQFQQAVASYDSLPKELYEQDPSTAWQWRIHRTGAAMHLAKTSEHEMLLTQGLEFFRQQQDAVAQLETLNYLTALYLETDFAKATAYCIQGIQFAQEKNEALWIAAFSGKLFYASQKAGDKVRAIEYFYPYFETYFKHGAYYRILGSSRQAANILRELNLPEEAEKVLDGEIQVAEQLGGGFALAVASDIFRQRQQHQQAINFALRACSAAAHSNTPHEIYFTSHALGHAYYSAGNYAYCIDILKPMLEAGNTAINLNNKIKSLQLLHDAYAKTANHQSAYSTLLQLRTAEQQQMNDQRMKEVAALNARYESEKKELELQRLKIKQQQTELDRADSELKAIKAQMNPHFIFNALNSIQEMFFLGDKKMANEHLGKFSQLTRAILKASGKAHITLAEEIEMLKQYLDLEALRFEHNFHYQIDLPDPSWEEIPLPPMLIQPYVENAIRHGLLHQVGEKQLQIHFQWQETLQQLEVTVSDNGIGRQAASRMNASRNALHESFSTDANARRLQLLNQGRPDKIAVAYRDEHPGTTVIIRIPVNF
ncbi:MAG: histidine kinase [Chitinophagales bacterium]